MLEQKIFRRFPDTSTETLPQLSLSLYAQQKKMWPLFSEGVKALDGIRTKVVECDTFSVRLQYNPKRIVSSGANIDAASIKARKCFLSLENLPSEQLGVLYQETFLVLCNPAPIFPGHFTISHIEHIPQSAEEYIIIFLDLAKDFSATHTIFYNGPKCGASAPDHMHFQASPKNAVPIEYEAALESRKVFQRSLGEVQMFTLRELGRAVIVLEGKKKQDMEFSFLRLTGAMRSVMNVIEEPMMNVLCSYGDDQWRMIVFPRTKHRPDVYFKEGDEKVVISPAAVDIGGLIVTPVEKDFLHVDENMVRQIFQEVSISNDMLMHIVQKM
ncbi:MAG: DUF4922 domain-containing protein [Bacteroidota bacterium]|nr:DUF4922 domain-containing protein [Bacteroidota bacterium]